MREMRRKDKLQGEEAALRLLERCEYAVLATVNEDGTPYCIPINPVLIEGNVYFHCARQGQKNDNLQRQNVVCLTCVGETRRVPLEFTMEYQSAVAFGKACMVEDTQEKVKALRLLCEKYAASNLSHFEEELNRSLKHTGVYKIALTKVTGKGRILPDNG